MIYLFPADPNALIWYFLQMESRKHPGTMLWY